MTNFAKNKNIASLNCKWGIKIKKMQEIILQAFMLF